MTGRYEACDCCKMDGNCPDQRDDNIVSCSAHEKRLERINELIKEYRKELKPVITKYLDVMKKASEMEGPEREQALAAANSYFDTTMEPHRIKLDEEIAVIYREWQGEDWGKDEQEENGHNA